jgi:hypothetical protein
VGNASHKDMHSISIDYQVQGGWEVLVKTTHLMYNRVDGHLESCPVWQTMSASFFVLDLLSLPTKIS